MNVAALIAENAAAALRESRRERRRVGISTPTWTGRSGKSEPLLCYLGEHSLTFILTGTAGVPRLPGSPTPPPRFGQKVKGPVSSAGTSPATSPARPAFGSGAVSGFKGLQGAEGGAVSSSSLLAQMRERKALEEAASRR